MNKSLFENQKQKDNVGWIIAFHGTLIALTWVSPFLFPWWVIVLGIGAYFLQLAIWGDCVLTRAQFETNNKRAVSFYYFLLVELGFKPNMQRVRWIADTVIPWVILSIALLWQQVFNQSVLF